ncbi:MAG: AMP-binding protein, partial [Burkholderiaceae bacterium]|nr:AMP-binding protein [Burkholderiaceae bacterium]
MTEATASSTSSSPAANAGAVPPPAPQRNPLRTRADWQRQRQACLADPGAFHGAIAAREVHWWVPPGADPAIGPAGAWLSLDDASGTWRGWCAARAEPVATALGEGFAPWARAFDDSQPPHWRWFTGGFTNAGFNEVDRHVLAGHGDEDAVIFEGDRWDMAADGGRGAPLESERISRRRLLVETAKCAIALRQLGLQPGDRIALNLPNIPQQLYWTEAAKRLGIVYTPVFGGFSDKTLSDRIHDAGARVVITADGGYRMAQVVPYKTAYTDPALDNFVPLATARAVVAARLPSLPLGPAQAQR